MFTRTLMACCLVVLFTPLMRGEGYHRHKPHGDQGGPRPKSAAAADDWNSFKSYADGPGKIDIDTQKEYSGKEAPAPADQKPAEPTPPKWQVKVLVLQPFSRKRSGYAQTAKEETKTVCKECCVCCPVPPGCCPKCQKVAVLVEEKYYVPAIIKKDDLDLKYDGHAIKTVSIP